MGKKSSKNRKKNPDNPRSNASKSKSAGMATSTDPAEASNLFQAGRYAEGIALLQDDLKPEQRNFLEQWGRHCMQEKKFDAAASLFHLVAQLFPRDDKAYNALAVALLMAGYQEQSLDAMKRCVELAPDSWRHRLNLGKLYMLKENWSEAKDELNTAMKGASGSQLSQIHEYLGLCQKNLEFTVRETPETSYRQPPSA